jgi:hypothetical protein
MRCPACKNEIPEWARDSCPNCGASIKKKKSAVLPYIALGVIIVIVSLIFFMPTPPPTCPPSGCGNVTPTPKITIRPTPCPDPIAITVFRQAGSSIIVTNAGGPGISCVTNFTVQVNGVANPQILGANAGSMVSIKSIGAAGTDSVVVVGNYKNGAQQVVLQKSV